NTYTATDSDVGHTIGCRVSATNRVTSVTADSAPVTIEPTPVQSTSGPPPAGLPPPVLFKRVNIVPISGTVRVKLPGAKSFVRIQDALSVPVGTIVDTTHGVVEIVAARDALGHTQTGTFFGGMFKIVQLPGRPPTADRCDGTLVKVVKGAVTVRDFVRRHSVVVRARHQYLARAPSKRHK